MRPTVLREVDQRRDRSPAVCVKDGTPTDRATRATATDLAHAARWEAIVGAPLTAFVARRLRRATTTVVLAISEAAWRRWRGRLARAVGALAAGLGLVVAGLLQGAGGLIGLGVLLLALGGWLRRRASEACWVGLTYRPSTGDILVTRTHPAFDAEARRLYVDSIRRRP